MKKSFFKVFVASLFLLIPLTISSCSLLPSFDDQETTPSGGGSSEPQVEEKYKVTLEPNGSASSAIIEEVVKGKKYIVPSCPFIAPSGCVFASWTASHNNVTYYPGAKITVDRDFTLIAMWDEIPEVIPVTGIELNTDYLTINPGDIVTLVATVYPSNASNKNVSWSSSNPSGVGVDGIGNIHAFDWFIGTVIITATTHDGGFTATAKIDVTEDEVPLISITIAYDDFELEVGESVHLPISFYPSNPIIGNLIWTSTNVLVATVSSAGVVTAVGVGTADIKVTSEENVNIYDTVTVTVYENSSPLSISFDRPSVVMEVGQIWQLNIDYSGEEPLMWASSDNSIATVSSYGAVTGIKEGTVTVTVKFVNYQYISANCTVTVVDQGSGGDQGDYFITEPTEITIKTTFNDTYGQIWMNAAESLMQKEPNITINYEKYSGSYSALTNEIVSQATIGNYPDICVTYPDNIHSLIEAGIAYDIGSYINNPSYGFTQSEYDDFYSALMNEGMCYAVDGTYSLPIAKSTEAMYYDRDKILGLVLPGVNNNNPISEEYINNLTWEELFNVFCPALLAYRDALPAEEANQFLNTEKYSDWAAVGYDSDDNLFITLAEQYGYDYTSIDPMTGSGVIGFNNSGMKGLMRMFSAAHINNYFTTKGIIGINVNNRTNEDAMLFSICSTAGVNYQFSNNNPKNVGVAPIPHAEGKSRKSILQGPSVSFLTHGDSNRELASWLFYKELASTENQLSWAVTTGYMPIRKSVIECDEYQEYCELNNYSEQTIELLKARNAQFMISCQDSLFFTPVFKGSSEARIQVGGLTTECINSVNINDNTMDSLFQAAYENTVLGM